MLIRVIYTVFVIAYSCLLLFAAVKGTAEKNKAYKEKENIIMIIGALLTLFSVIAVWIPYFLYIVGLVAGLILIHIASILNGKKLHGKINLSHHITKLILSIVIIALFVFSCK